MELQIAALKAQLAEHSTKGGNLTVKHSNYREPTATDKGLVGGTVSVSGLNSRFPVTLHADQWFTLLDFAPVVIKHIQDHADDIVKGRKPLKVGEKQKGSDANGLRVKASQYLAKIA
jgi:hypothetical protein